MPVLDDADQRRYLRAADEVEADRAAFRVSVAGRDFQVIRVIQLVRVGPDGPEPPRPSDPDPDLPVEIAVQEQEE